jgi:hypothetical protein
MPTLIHLVSSILNFGPLGSLKSSAFAMGNKDKQAIIKAGSHPARTMPLSLSLLKLLFCETLKTEASPQLLTLIPLLVESSFEDTFLYSLNRVVRWKVPGMPLSRSLIHLLSVQSFGTEEPIKKKSANM